MVAVYHPPSLLLNSAKKKKKYIQEGSVMRYDYEQCKKIEDQLLEKFKALDLSKPFSFDYWSKYVSDDYFMLHGAIKEAFNHENLLNAENKARAAIIKARGE